ncbi:hypothetical protein Trydic_g14740 [Trypoxylus dichotomus]
MCRPTKYRCASALFESHGAEATEEIFRISIAAEWCCLAGAVARQPGVNLANTGKRRIFFIYYPPLSLLVRAGSLPFGSERVSTSRDISPWAVLDVTYSYLGTSQPRFSHAIVRERKAHRGAVKRESRAIRNK